jgi:hypothetical protein
LDLVAYDGYKFVGVIVTLIAGLLNFGATLYAFVFLYSFLATAFFLVCGSFSSPVNEAYLAVSTSSAPFARLSCQMQQQLLHR